MTASSFGACDSLTGLLDRRGVEAALEAADPSAPVAAVVVDVDGFGSVNETYGLAVGDRVLQQLARRFAAVAPEATLGRWGGDEFVLLLIGPPAANGLRHLAQSLVAAARTPLTEDGLDVSVSVSVGIARDVPAGEDVFVAAGVAVRAAQRAGRDQVAEYVEGMNPLDHGGGSVAAELRRAIDEDGLCLDYQPILELSTGRTVAVEALVRWVHPVRGKLLPAEFFGVAERTGLVVPLGAWVLNEACRMAASWSDRGENGLRTAINLSGRQLLAPGLVDAVRTAIDEHGCRGEQLIFEVSETTVLEENSPAVTVLTALKRMGAGLTIDHFGTHDSPLRYLTQLPVDTIKIDRTFVGGLGRRRKDTAIVGSLIALAHKLELFCVAEGVETPEQRDMLEDQQCDLVQGYLFSRPVDAPTVESWVQLRSAEKHHHLEPTPRFSPETARIAALHEAGASSSTIAAALNAENAPTASGARWSRQSVEKILTRSQTSADDETRTGRSALR